MDADEFGGMLRQHRLATGLTQEELAGRAELSVRAVSDLERGRTTRPLRHSVRQLAAALGLAGKAAEEFTAHALARSGTGSDGDAASALAAERGSPDPAGPSSQQRPGPAVPRQLPAPVRYFAGRGRELAALTDLIDRSAGRTQETVVISAIGGPAGVGKTALALHWAHQVADRFQDGQLYVNLRGYDADEPLPVVHALAGFLRALGVDGRDIPADGQERAARYRSVLAGRQVLVVLDNARAAEQVRPLLPGTPGCVAIVTSRDMLAGLVARDGAARLELDVLPQADTLALLRALLGARVDAEPDAAAALAALCCRLPLALRIAAELATARPAAPLASLVAELTDHQRRLDLLGAGGDAGTAVRSVFSWSYRHLDPVGARAFRLIGLHPGPDLEPYAAAALTGTTHEQADRLLAELARAHLIQAIGGSRYGMHDLLRVYAREKADAEDKLAGPAALTGLFEHYLHTSAAAMDTVYPAETSRRPRLLPFAGALAPVADLDAAQGWLDAERANLIAAAGYAADCGWPGHATRLSATLDRYLNFGYHLSEAITVHGHALRASRHISDRSAEAAALTHLGFVEWLRNRYEQAADYQRQALALYDAAGDRLGQARALHRLALAERLLGQFQQSIGHAERALALARQDMDRLGQARALQNLGIIKRMQGRFAQAAAHQQQALALFDELRDRLGESVTIKEIGVIELRLGRLGPAAEHFRRAVTLCRETSNLSGQAEAISQLGLVHLRRGHQAQATEHHQRALAMFREISDREREAEVLGRLALAYLQAGRHGQAIGQLEHALELSRRIGARPLETAVLNGLGEALLEAGQPGQSRGRHAAALELAGQTGNHDQRARAHQGLAHAHTTLGDADQAERHWQQAFDLYTRLGVPEAAQVPGARRGP